MTLILLLEKWKCLSIDVVDPSRNAEEAPNKIFSKQNTTRNSRGDDNLKFKF